MADNLAERSIRCEQIHKSGLFAENKRTVGLYCESDREREVGAGAVQVDTGDLGHAAHPVADRVGVDAQQVGGGPVVALGVEPGAECLHVAGAVLVVVAGEARHGVARRNPSGGGDPAEPAQQDLVPVVVVADCDPPPRVGGVQGQAFVGFLAAFGELVDVGGSADPRVHFHVGRQGGDHSGDPVAGPGHAGIGEHRVDGGAEQGAASRTCPPESGGDVFEHQQGCGVLVVADVCLQGHDPERADGQAELGGHQRIAAAFEELDHPVGFDLAFQVGAGAGAQQVQGHGAGPAFQSGGARRGEGCFGVHPDGAEEFPSGADGDHDTSVEPVFGHGWHEQRLVGFGEVRREAVEKLEKVKKHTTFENVRSDPFYRAVIKTCDAAILMSKRYAEGCRRKAETASPERRAELLKMADSCDWIMEHPARTFWEGLQAMLFYQYIIAADGLHWADSPALIDSILGGLLEKDLQSGKLTPEQAQELADAYILQAGNQIIMFPKPNNDQLIAAHKEGKTLFDLQGASQNVAA